MPRGVPKKGYRVTRKRAGAATTLSDLNVPVEAVTTETDAEIRAKLEERFGVLDAFAHAATNGELRAMVVSGPAGLGKSFTVETAMQEWDPEENNHTIVKGYVKPTGLYKLLYQHRKEGQVIIFDDADTIFNDETALNMLKAVCDTTDRRRVSYLAEYDMVCDQSADIIPRQFEFEGTIIFITNLDFDALIERGHKIAAHLEALVSRSYYIDLAMKTRRDYLIRIMQVVELGLLRNRGLTKQEEMEVMAFIDKNQNILRELSLRIAIKVADLRRNHADTWEKLARVTCCKNQ